MKKSVSGNKGLTPWFGMIITVVSIAVSVSCPVRAFAADTPATLSPPVTPPPASTYPPAVTPPPTGLHKTRILEGNDLILRGSAEDGLAIESDNDTFVKYFFNLDQLTPGDYMVAKLDIRNTDADPFTLTVEVQDTSANHPFFREDDTVFLIDKLSMKIVENGTVLTTLTDLSSKRWRYDFTDKFLPGDDNVRTIEFWLYLEGASTGNDYMEKDAALVWIFTANISPGESSPPSSPPSNPPPSDRRRSRTPSSSPPGDNPPGTPPETPPTVVDEQETPMGPTTIVLVPPEQPEPEPEITLEEDVPLGTPKEMPKTGEISLLYGLSGGALLIGAGLMLLRKRNEKEEEKEKTEK